MYARCLRRSEGLRSSGTGTYNYKPPQGLETKPYSFARAVQYVLTPEPLPQSLVLF